MSDQIDISREACERAAQALHRLAEPFGKTCVEGLMILALRDAFDAAEAERDELAAVISGIEVSNGLTDNGNLWRFWSSKCKELAQKVVAAEADKARAVEATLDATHEYLVAVYGHSPLAHPVDRARVAAAIRTGAKP